MKVSGRSKADVPIFLSRQDIKLPSVQLFHAIVLAYNKRLDEAYTIFDQNYKTYPENIFSQIGIFFKYALQNEKMKALQSINYQMLDWYKRDFTNPYSLVLGLSLINEKDKALDWLEEWIKLGCINYPLFKNDPFLENIRGEERFKKLMKKVKYEWENFEI